jgi:hypothetical protein
MTQQLSALPSAETAGDPNPLRRRKSQMSFLVSDPI